MSKLCLLCMSTLAMASEKRPRQNCQGRLGRGRARQLHDPTVASASMLDVLVGEKERKKEKSLRANFRPTD